MSTTKRFTVGLVAALGMIIAAITMFASSSSAGTAGSLPTGPNPGTSVPNPYPSSGGAGGTTTVSTSTTAGGGGTTASAPGSGTTKPGSCSTSNSTSSVGVTCSGFAGETTLCVGTSPGDDNLASGRSGADGSFNTSIPTSSLHDGQTVYVGPCNGTAAESARVTIALGGGSSGSGGNLSNTGIAVVGIGALGVVLLIGGGALLLAGRRRRGAHA